MSQEPSQDQEPIILSRTPAVQGASGEDQLSAEVTPGPETTDSEEFKKLLLKWIDIKDKQRSLMYLEAHPNLLTKAAEALLAVLQETQQTDQARITIAEQRLLLWTAREQGITAAYHLSLDPADLNTVGIQLAQQYQTTGQAEYLNQALQRWRLALQLIPSDSPNRQALLTNLGTGLSDRYAHTGALHDLNAAITAYQEAVQITSPNSPDRPIFLTNLGTGLIDRYTRTGAPDDLETALSVFQQAVQITSLDSPNRPALLTNLGTGLSNRYARTGALADLDAAITAYQQAIQITSPDSPDRPGHLSNLGNGLFNRYARTRTLADLEAALSAYQQAVQTTPPNSPDRPRHLSNLGNGLRSRYALTGALADLEMALSTFQQAVQISSPNAPDRSALMTNLGNGLSDRYTRTGALADLEAAISAYQQAVQTTPLDSPDRPGRLNNLGTGFSDRYARTGALDNLEAALSAYQEAVQTTPLGSPDRPRHLCNLGNGLRSRYARTGALADLEAAISAYQQALQITPPDASDRPDLLTNLGNGLRSRYALTGALADLEAAISAYQHALQITPLDSPARSAYLSNLGNGLGDRYVHSGVLEDLEAAISAWKSSWSMSGLRFATLPVDYKLGQQLQAAHVAAPLIMAYLERAWRQHSSALADRRAALEIAESTKSRLLTQLVGRGPLPIPAKLPSQVAMREQQLLAILTALDTQELGNYNRLVPAQEEFERLNRLQQRQASLSELEQLWSSIARLGTEGAEYVALRRGDAPTWKNFAQLARDLGSATVLLSLFVTADRMLLWLLRAPWRLPQMIEAPLDQVGWENLRDRFFREVHRYTPELRRSETWDQALQPLMEQAEHHLVSVERLILAPAGSGHLLPWGVLAQRAGWRTPTREPLPLVTLPALGVLPRLRQRPYISTGPALVVGNPIGDLPYAEAEAKMVAERFGTTALLRRKATKEAVLSRLVEASQVHLATHAFFDPKDPLGSGIVLANGVLSAREILGHRLQADLLVLSSCESGQVGSLGGEELAGLSQAFLQAGVRSLLVSLWEVNDPATAAFMQAFYDAREAGADKAQALRQAMTQIQQEPHWIHPYYWGAFALMGDWE